MKKSSLTFGKVREDSSYLFLKKVAGSVQPT